MLMPTSVSGPTPDFCRYRAELVSPSIQLAAISLLVAKDHCYGIRRSLHFRFEELMKAFFFGVFFGL